MHTRHSGILIALVLTAPAIVGGQQAPPPFRSSVNLILVDVTVRDGKGQAVRNLQASDFEILENGKPQAIVTFAQEDVTVPAQTIVTASTLTRLGEAKGGVPVSVAAIAAADPAAAGVDASRGPLTSAEVAGRRIWVLLFD